jgi:hypothetical protein
MSRPLKLRQRAGGTGALKLASGDCNPRFVVPQLKSDELASPPAWRDRATDAQLAGVAVDSPN